MLFFDDDKISYDLALNLNYSVFIVLKRVVPFSYIIVHHGSLGARVDPASILSNALNNDKVPSNRENGIFFMATKTCIIPLVVTFLPCF